MNSLSLRNLSSAILLAFILTLTTFAQSRVTVNNGYVGAIYKGSARLAHVWANANPPNMVFDRWTGDTHLLIDPTAWHTRVNLRQKTINLTATYKNAPAWNPVYEQVNGREYGFYFPPNVRGLIFRFHGTGGSGATFFNKLEDRFSADNYVAAGFAVVALDSNNRTDKQWDNTNIPPNNIDIANVQTVINSFISRGLITAATPIFAVGMSNGGAFAPRVAYALQFRGAAVYCAAGGTFVNLTNVPTTWNIAQFDGNEMVGANGNAAALRNFQTLTQRGVAAQHNLHVSSPIYPQRFIRISGLTAADSQIIFDSLKNNGLLDSQNFLIENPATSNWQSVIPAQYAVYGMRIRGQLDAAYAEHEYFSDHDGRVIAFFNARF